VVGYAPFSLCVIHKEGLCPSSGDINDDDASPTCCQKIENNIELELCTTLFSLILTSLPLG
jgi:hypothetical protein